MNDAPQAIGPYRLLGQLGPDGENGHGSQNGQNGHGSENGHGSHSGHGGPFLGRAPNGERVAVTVIPARLATDPGFRAEVAAARTVSGAVTVPVVDADLDAPVPWLATAYVAAPPLADVVRDRGPLSPRAVLALATGLAEGLRALHAAGLVHGNLDPSNVLLSEDGPRMADFGTWRAALPGTELGSPGFLSPEQALGHDVGPPGDIFGLGAVLVYAASGHGPFGSGSSALLMYRLVNSLAELDGLPDQLRGPVGSCLAKQPDSRPSASSLLTELGAIQPEALSARAVSRRDPGSPAAAVTAASVSVAGASAVANGSSPARVPAAGGGSSVTGGGSPGGARGGAGIRGAAGPGGGPRRGWPAGCWPRARPLCSS